MQHTTVPLIPLALAALAASAQIAVRGALVHTAGGAPIEDGVVLIEGKTIRAVGPAASTPVPEGWRVLQAAVVTPGLVDAHSVVGLSGWLNYAHDQDQLDKTAAIQPELRALDAYDAREPLIGWLRSLGVTTLHTGHGPGAVISGQTMVVKTRGETVAAALVDPADPHPMVACTLGADAVGEGKGAGTRSKAVAILRAELIKAQEYGVKLGAADEDKRPARDLKLETLGRVLAGELPLLVTAQRGRDIDAALRLREEFGFRLVLDGAADAPSRVAEIRAASVPVILHATMIRPEGDEKNASMETAALLAREGIPFAIQSGYEGYVPKTRCVLFEAAIACKQGLPFEHALAAITIAPAKILGLESRIGSLEVGKDADVALWDGDPFEYATHCVGVLIDGAVVSETPR